MSVKSILWIVVLSVLLNGRMIWAESWKEAPDPREKSRERIQMIKMWRLTEVLKLDKEGAARFFAVNHHYEEALRKAHREYHEDLQRVRNLLREMNPPERELREMVLRLKSKKKEMNDLENRQLDEELSLLRPEQQAMYFLFQSDFKREMDQLIWEIKGEKSPRPYPDRIPIERKR
jgi:hypothetical protein